MTLSSNLSQQTIIILWPLTILIIILLNVILLYALQPGMSEIRDRAQAAPVKSRKFRDNGLPVSG
jgi:hypothetical protein